MSELRDHLRTLARWCRDDDERRLREIVSICNSGSPDYGMHMVDICDHRPALDRAVALGYVARNDRQNFQTTDAGKEWLFSDPGTGMAQMARSIEEQAHER